MVRVRSARSCASVLLASTLGLTTAACSRQPCADGEGRGPVVRLDVALDACNAPPRAVISAPGNAAKGRVVVFDGAGSADSNGDALQYFWAVVSVPSGSAVALADPAVMMVSFVPDVTGSYTLSLAVSDGELASEPVTATVVVRNSPPVAAAGGDVSSALDVPVTLDGSGSADPDGDPLTYAWALLSRPRGSNAELEAPTEVRARLTPDVIGMYEVALEVRDPDGESSVDRVVVAGGITGGPPTAVAGPDQEVETGDLVQLDGSRSRDPDGDPLTHRWVMITRPPMSLATLATSTTARTSFTPDLEGLYEVRLVVDDGYFESAPDVVSIQADANPAGPTSFDPTRVYLIGTLQEGRQGAELICSTSLPRTVSFGWVFEDLIKVIHPTLRQVLYTGYERGLFLFVPDVIPEGSQLDYPPNPGANDIQIPTPACGTDVGEVVVNPIDGEIWYSCLDSDQWYDERGTLMDTCSSGGLGEPGTGILLLGYDGSMYCGFEIRDATGTDRPITHPAGNLEYVRARPAGGFWGLYRQPNLDHQRWVHYPDGRSELELTVPAPNYILNGEGVLDGDGVIYQGIVPNALNDAVMRLDGMTQQIIFNEATDTSICRVQGSRRVSGP